MYFKPKEITWEENSNGCWICTSHAPGQSDSRPMVCRNGKHENMARFVFRKYKGEIPKGKEICHTCDNPMCINPEHLWAGTHLENIKDRDAKGRVQHPIGEKNNRAKLNSEQVREIRKATGTLASIAKPYNVTLQQVWCIKHRKTWGHVV